MKVDTPVLLIAFNKVDTTKRVLDQLTKFNIRNVYFSIDGARNDKEEKTVREVKSIICEYKHLSHENLNIESENLGCRKHVIKAITNFFKQHPSGIILEDDTLPSESFFKFCSFLLKRYEEDKSIWHIGGYKPPVIDDTPYSYTYTKATHVWGWATWADRWEKYIETLTDDQISEISNFNYFDSKFKTKKRIKQLKAVNTKKVDTWDFNWNATVRLNNGLAIRPNTNLVENIGLGNINATNTSSSKKAYKGKLSDNIDLKNFIGPPFKLPLRKLERQFESSL